MCTYVVSLGTEEGLLDQYIVLFQNLTVFKKVLSNITLAMNTDNTVNSLYEIKVRYTCKSVLSFFHISTMHVVSDMYKNTNYTFY